MAGASKLMIAALALSFALMLVGYADPVAARQRARVVLDDASRLPREDRDAVRRAARFESEISGPRPTFVISVVPSLAGASIEQVARNRLERFAGGSVQDLVLIIAPREDNALLAVRDTGDLARATGTTPAEVQLALGHASAAAKRHLRDGGDPGDAARAAISDFSGSSGGNGGDEVGGWGAAAKGIGLVLLPVLPFVVLFFVWRGMRARRRLKSFAGGVQQVRELKAGQAVVAGAALANQAMEAPLSRKLCVAWQIAAQERYQRTKRETRYRRETGLDGEMVHERYEVEVPDTPGLDDVGKTEWSTPFYVRDETGDVLVWPEEAELKLMPSDEIEVGRSDSRYGIVDKREHYRSLGVRLLTESVILVGRTVTVIGPVEVAGDGPQFRWTRASGPSVRDRFFITVDDPGTAAKSERRRMVRSFAYAAAASALIAVVLSYATSASP